MPKDFCLCVSGFICAIIFMNSIVNTCAWVGGSRSLIVISWNSEFNSSEKTIHNLQCDFDAQPSRIQYHPMANHFVQPHWFRCQMKSPASKTIKNSLRANKSLKYISSPIWMYLCKYSFGWDIKFNTNYFHFPFFMVAARRWRWRRKQCAKWFNFVLYFFDFRSFMS